MIKEKIKSLVKKKTSGDNKKTLENLIVFLVLLIITVIAINIIWGKENNNEKQSPIDDSYKVLAYNKNESNNSQDSEYNLEKKLENILSQISGVGKVQVLITYSETSSVVAMRNEKKNSSKTEENDTNRWNKINRINR
jgi:stage III sporulation protein AG